MLNKLNQLERLAATVVKANVKTNVKTAVNEEI